MKFKVLVYLAIVVSGLCTWFYVGAINEPTVTIKETQVTTDPADQWYPAIYGDTIVWGDTRNGNFDIYIDDLATGTETQVTTDPSNKFYPDIYGDTIVWMDNRNGNFDIYMYDLSTGT